MSSTRIPVYFTQQQVAPEQVGIPSAAKPAAVVSSWQERVYPIEVRSFEPVTRRQLALAHERAYVAGVLSCEEENGFGTRDRAVAASLPYTTGSMLAAGREALATRQVAVSPTSGFHHAGWMHGAGFCTFNGLVVTARVLLSEGASAVGILDCDQHFGDGTCDILETIAEPRIHHETLGEHSIVREDLKTYLGYVRKALRRWAKLDVPVVLYQAGADPHVDDPLGGLLTSAQLRERDAFVFEECRKLGLGVAWNLAGGYQRDKERSIRPVLDIHDATMEECVRVWSRAG